jgi:hypothetical protein
MEGKFGPSGGIGGSENQGYRDTLGPPRAPDRVVVAIGHYDSGAWLTRIDFRIGNVFLAQLAGNGTVDFEFPPFILNPNEYIVEISGYYGVYVNSVKIVTNSGRASQLYTGASGTIEYKYTAGTGEIITGLWGRTGSWIDAIGVYTAVSFPVGPSPSRH